MVSATTVDFPVGVWPVTTRRTSGKGHLVGVGDDMMVKDESAEKLGTRHLLA
jgi:hypothetical protein